MKKGTRNTFTTHHCGIRSVRRRKHLLVQMSWVVKESEEVTQKIPPNLMIAAELSIHPPHTTAEGIGAAKQVSISWGEFDTA